jgi:benzoylformate decarboxylase
MALQTTKTGTELVQDFIRVNDVEYVFGCPGTTETTFLAAVAGSSAKYVLGLTEPVVVGVAAGYALATGRTALVSLHTYPGLASGMFNIRNAQLSGIPMLIMNGTEDSRFLIHNPVLGGPNTELAATATKYQYEVRSIDELTVALQRCWVQAGLQPTQPVFLSVPMNFMLGKTERVTFKKTRVFDDVVSSSIGTVVAALKAAKKLAVVSDYAVGWDRSVRALTNVAQALRADVWAAPYHVQGACDMLHPGFKGQLPDTTSDVRRILNGYDTVLLLGDKIDTFTFTGDQAVPPDVTLIQITPATNQLGFDWPVDIGVVGDIEATLIAIAGLLGVDPSAPLGGADRKVDLAALEAKYPASGPHASNALILAVLRELDASKAHVVTEGSSEDGIVQDMAISLGFRNVYFSPRGGGLGWAMPLSVGLTLGGAQAVCFVGDGGGMFSLPAVWSAAAAKLPVVFVVFVNHEYRLLKDLWVQFMNTDFAATKFVGLDFNDPALDLDSIMRGFGAVTVSPVDAEEVATVMREAKDRDGPTVLFVNRER